MKKLLIACLLGGSLSLGVQASDEHASHHAEVESATDLNQGEVRKVDVENRKLTLRHGPIAVMAMPPITSTWPESSKSMILAQSTARNSISKC